MVEAVDGVLWGRAQDGDVVVRDGGGGGEEAGEEKVEIGRVRGIGSVFLKGAAAEEEGVEGRRRRRR